MLELLLRGRIWIRLKTRSFSIAGAITSGLGYALWYRVLPALPTTVAGIAQLNVPVVAVAAGVAFLGESLSLRLIIAGILVLGGIAVSLSARR